MAVRATPFWSRSEPGPDRYPRGIGTEVERKFLVDRVPEGHSGPDGSPIEQGYLAIDAESEVRLRRVGDALTLTVKQGHGEKRGETEVELDQATFDELWPESAGRRVSKHRRRIEIGAGLVAELDIYADELEGLATVEVEFDSEADAYGFRPPDWFGRELTGDPVWANQSLAVYGKPDKRLRYRLRPGEEPASGICRIIAARAAQAVAEVRAASAADDSAEHVHEARKSLKKTRSALRLLRGVISDEERREVNGICRDAARHLAGARDAEVKLATLGLVTGDRVEAGGVAVWRRELELEAAGHRGSLNPEALAEVMEAVEGVRRRFQGREMPGAGESVAGNVGRGYRRGRKAMKRARQSREPEAFHDWRKRAKDLRYQLEVLSPRLPEQFDGIRKQAEQLAEKLGDLHDLDVLADDLTGRALGVDDRWRQAELITDARDELAEECLELGVETYPVKPGRFTNLAAESLSVAA